MRGDRSQTQLYRRLNYASSVVDSWESGRLYPPPHRGSMATRRSGAPSAGVPPTRGLLHGDTASHDGLILANLHMLALDERPT